MEIYFACGACDYIGHEKPVCFSSDCYAIKMVIDRSLRVVSCDPGAGHCRRPAVGSLIEERK